ncbi:MAG: hypothetical protein AMXMBFR66_12990 [Pseudomonadota bacterium]|nr:antibiotic biosynthesis monooxygenase [Rubrivivax sp.]NLZ40155.1 hypothetical protein [Comamonadaceae bacterium]
MTIAIYIEYEPKAGLHEALLARVRQEARQCMGDDGCLRMEVAVPQAGDDTRVHLVELWRDRAALEAHAVRPGHSHAWQEALVARKRVSVCTVLESPAPR